MFNYTEEGLPVISRENAESLRSINERAELSEEDVGKFFVIKLKEENPAIVELLGLLIGNTEILGDNYHQIEMREDIEDAYFRGAYCAYELIGRQNASNILGGLEIKFDEKRYTPDGLPKITKETFLSYFDLVKKEGLSATVSEFKERLTKENPEIVALISEYAERDDRDKLEKGAFMCGAHFTYELLRRQAAAYKLEEIFG